MSHPQRNQRHTNTQRLSSSLGSPLVKNIVRCASYDNERVSEGASQCIKSDQSLTEMVVLKPDDRFFEDFPENVRDHLLRRNSEGLALDSDLYQ